VLLAGDAFVTFSCGGSHFPLFGAVDIGIAAFALEEDGGFGDGCTG